MELGYADCGKFRRRMPVAPAGFLDTSVKSHGIDLSAVGLLPLGDRFTLFAGAGAFASRSRASYSSGGSVQLVDGRQEQTRTSTHWVFGVGAMYDFLPDLALRAEWARYDRLGDDLTGGRFNARTISVGIQWRF